MFNFLDISVKRREVSGVRREVSGVRREVSGVRREVYKDTDLKGFLEICCHHEIFVLHLRRK